MEGQEQSDGAGVGLTGRPGMWIYNLLSMEHEQNVL